LTQRAIGRRSLFFAAAALVCVFLVPATPPDFRWVAWFTAGLGAFWAVLLAIEDLATPSAKPREGVGPAPESPFEPPPPPDFTGK
jgi:hypothetical protein